MARLAITVGGLTVIASVIAILFLIFQVTIPLFTGTSSRSITTQTPAGIDPADIMAMGLDEYLESGFAVLQDGSVAFVPLTNAAPIERRSIPKAPGATLAKVTTEGNDAFTLLWDNGAVSLLKVSGRPVFDQDSDRTIHLDVETTDLFEPTATADEISAVLARKSDTVGTTVVLLRRDNQITVLKTVITTSLFGDETTEQLSFDLTLEDDSRVTAITANREGSRLYAGTDRGTLLQWELNGDEPVALDTAYLFRDDTAITALGMVFGSVSLVVADSRGGLTTWMEVRPEGGGSSKLTRIHTLKNHPKPVSQILPSSRTKSVWSMSKGGAVHLDHMTSERHLYDWQADSGFRLFNIAGRGNGLITLAADGSLNAHRVTNPHPEVSFRTLFGKVWYESYPAPDYAWQSSSGSDDFEPKFSITPLLFGTIKGTVYAMLFAVPLAIFGAIYVSQFARPSFKNTIKPTIEIMASVPSVVIGFLAALWLAPIIEQQIITTFLAVLLVPTFFVLFMGGWQTVASRSLAVRHFPLGYEFLILLPVLALAIWLAAILSPWVETSLFSGSFKLWLFNTLGSTYDQRNCIIIAFGLGFTVIPIIFSIAEDSLSNVPPNLSAASLALGASRWQTVWRVILPSASPGIFAGIMIGFGRAVGETMIVLMATGNTPIMDWSMFNGMRTLSANIAVEIPEAPVGGTLYRVLFLCAVILFVMTFVLNTGAELVRDHLRKKYMRY